MSDDDHLRRRLVAPLAFVLFMAAGPASADAPDAKSDAKAIAIYVEGVSPDVVRTSVATAISERARVIDPHVFAEALEREGLHLPVGPALTTAAQRKSAISTLRNATTASGADSLVLGRSSQAGAKLSVALLWIDAKSPEPVIDKTVDLSGDGDADKATLVGALGAQLDAFAEPAATMPNGRRVRNEMSTAIVVTSLAFELGGRRFSYSDAITRNLPDYRVLGIPMPSVGAELYPAAAVPILRDIGLVFHFGRAFGLASATIAGTTVNTGWTTIGGGLRSRFRTGGLRSPVVGLAVGIDILNFDFDAKPDLANVVPTVKYVNARIGLDGRLPLGRFALLLDGGYDAPISAGPVHDRFRGRSVGGVDFGADLAMVLGAGFEVRIGGRYTRYFYTFHPFVGDAYVAGGALDEFVRFGVGGAYAY